jgi:SAM-dependent methyltransferase
MNVETPTDGTPSGLTTSADLYDEEALLHFGNPDEYEAFIQSQGQVLRPRIARALALADVLSGMRVLDIGCGKGEVVFRAAQAGAEVFGLDYSAGGLKLAHGMVEHLSHDAQKRVHLLQADAKSIPLSDATFDRILMLDVVEHLYPWELRQTLEEARRLLKPDGYLVIHTLPNRWTLQIGYPIVRLFLPSLPLSPRRECEGHVHVNEQDIVRLNTTLCGTGWATHVWLEGQTKDQAVWQQGGKQFADVRHEAYNILRHPLLAFFYTLLLRSPARLLLANDIYAIAWKAGEASPPIVRGSVCRGLSEKLYIMLARLRA